MSKLIAHLKSSAFSETESSACDVSVSPMEIVFGAPAAGGSHQPNVSSSANEDQSSSPSSYDTDLFPGGLSASTNAHSSTQSLLHPLLRSIQLPPINSLVSTASSRDSPQERNRSSTFIAESSGNLLRVNDYFRTEGSNRVARRPARPTSLLTGWVDDGLPPDRASEDFSVAFGSAIQALQQHFQPPDRTNPPNEDPPPLEPPNEDPPPLEETGTGPENNSNETEEQGNQTSTNPTQNSQVAVEGGDLAAAGQNDGGDDALNIAETPTTQGSQSEEAEVSSAMAAALTISQPESNPSILDNQREQVNPNNDGDVNGDAVMAEANPGNDANASENTEEQVAPEEDATSTRNTEVVDAADHLAAPGQNSDVVGAEAVPALAALDASAAASNNEMPPAQESSSDAANEPNSAPAEQEPGEGAESSESNQETNNPDQLVCPPDIDEEVFNCLPREMQQEIVDQHQVTAQISDSGFDPAALAALPEDMRREIIEQEQQQQRLREQEATQPAANPANAEEMDNADFLASLAPDLRQELLLTGDDAFISSLPPTIIAEANVLRERVAAQHRRRSEDTTNAAAGAGAAGAGARSAQPSEGHASGSRSRRQRNGKLRIESDRDGIVYTSENRLAEFGPLLTTKSATSFLSLLYLLSPVHPQRIIHKLVLNMCLCRKSRDFILQAVLGLLNNDKKHVLELLDNLNADSTTKDHKTSRAFPPSALIGADSNINFEDSTSRHTFGLLRRKQSGNSVSAAATMALPASSRGSSSNSIPPIVSRRIFALLFSLCKSSPRVAFSMLSNSDDCPRENSCLENLLDLFEVDQYSKSAVNLEQLLSLLEIVVAPLSLLPKEDQEIDMSDSSSPGREWVKVPRIEVSRKRLGHLIKLLRLDMCKEASFQKINTLARRLSRVEANRECILHELAMVAESLGKAAITDLKTVSVRLSSAAKHHRENGNSELGNVSTPSLENEFVAGTSSSAVSLSTSNSELKLLRVLQMLLSLCAQEDETRTDGNPPEFFSLLRPLNLDSLWDQLSVCLETVSVLEGVANVGDDDDNDGDDDENDSAEVNQNNGKKLQNSVAGLISRFLPAIEAFFIVNVSSPSSLEESQSGVTEEADLTTDNSRVVRFAASNKILLNALLRSNPQLLDKGLRAMVKMPKCRLFLDFDVKRQWFKTQVRRQRQQASRRHGSFRLNLRRKHVFEDSFHAFVHRNADELRGRLHITFRNEEGVDAGGVSREFFAILAKEMFNPNYALFMSTEDGCTFQPNPNSSINPDDMRYFRFVGRIVGKAVVDGFLLDAHFTRSLYKHMLGVKPTHHDMQAIDPDYYKNLQMILEHNLGDIGLDLTFSTDDHSFGRSRTIDLIPDGRNIAVTDETKERYVDLVCQHRMTSAIEKQIKAFLEGWNEIVVSVKSSQIKVLFCPFSLFSFTFGCASFHFCSS